MLLNSNWNALNKVKFTTKKPTEPGIYLYKVRKDSIITSVVFVTFSLFGQLIIEEPKVVVEILKKCLVSDIDGYWSPKAQF